MVIRDFSFPLIPTVHTAGYEAKRVKDLLPGCTSSDLVEFVSQDGEIVAVCGEEILEGEVCLAFDGSSAYRLVIPSDVHRRRWCKNIVEIRIEEEDDC